MRDLLYSFPDEATAHAVLDPMGFGANGAWDESRCLPVKLGIGRQQIGTDAETGAPIMAPIWHPAWWFVISVEGQTDPLYAVPYCMREADREKALAKLPYVVRERFTAEQLATPWFFDRQWCGVDYSNAGATA